MDVIVKESKIHGKGVFANRDFKRGEAVLKWDSIKLKKDDVSKYPKEYISYNKGEYYLMNPPEKFVNHSCEPNTNSKNKCDIAIRSIKKGEEITSDYSSDILPDFKMKCNCGSKNCKGVIKYEN